jgi:cellulose synthase operon protein C
MRRTTAILLCLSLSLAGCNAGRDQLLVQLQSARPEDRALALRKLAAQGRSEDLVLFTRAAKDPASVVRAEAASALGRSNDPRVVDLLGELLVDPDDQVQARAAMALAEVKNERAKAYLTLQYARRGRSTRQAIVEALKAANVPGAMASAVAAESQTLWDRNLRALQEGSLAERVAAAEELGKSGRAEAVNRLIPLTRDSHVILAAAAVRGLGHAGSSRAVPPIVELLTENFPELREAAIEALVRLQDPKALGRLRDIALEKSGSSSLATGAIISLGPGAESSRVLCEVALLGAAVDAQAAARALRARDGCPIEPFVERLARRAEQADILAALAALGPTAQGATPRILPLLATSDLEGRAAAVRALAELGHPSAREPVQKLYEQEQRRVAELRRDWVTDALPESYAEGFDPGSLARLSDPYNPDGRVREQQDTLMRKVRQVTEQKLKDAGRVLQGPGLEPVELVEDVDERELAVLSATLEALGRLGVDGALETLEPWRTDGAASLRAAAYTGLSALEAEGVALAKQGLLDPHRHVQGKVATVLAEQGAEGQGAIAELLPRLAGDRLLLLHALDRAGPEPLVAPALIQLVEEGAPDAAVAAQLLGRLAAKPAVPALLAQLDDPTSVARRDALVALGRIGDPAAAEAIARELNHDTPEVRAAAVEALAALGANPRPTALDALKGDYYRRVRDAVDAALTRLGASSPMIEAKSGE